MKRQIYKLYVYNAIINFSLVAVIRNIYLEKKGFSLFQIGILLSIFVAAKIVLEIPTGFIADYFGNKASLVTALLLHILALIVMISFTSFSAMVISFIFLALAYTMTTGCYDTILIDLTEKDSNISLIDINSKNRFIEYTFFGIASLISGYIYLKSIPYIFGLNIALLSIATIIIFSIPYKKKAKPSNLHTSINTIIQHLFQNNILFYFVLIEATINFAMMPIEEFYLNYLENIFSISVKTATLIKGMQFIIVSLFAVFLSKYFKKYNEKVIIKALPIAMLSCFFLFTFIKNGIAAILLYMVSLLIFCCFAPVKYTVMQRSILPEYRTTVLSIKSIFTTIAVIGSQPFFGWIGDKYSMQIAARILLFLSIGSFLIINVFFRQINFDNNRQM